MIGFWSSHTASFLVDRMKADGVTFELTVAGTVSVGANGRNAVFAPITALKSRRVHNITLTTQVADVAGNPLAATFTSSLSVIIIIVAFLR